MSQSTIATELDLIITRLKNSPLYNLSLTSKELFHSNLLAWLCECYPTEMGVLFAPFLTKPTAVGSNSITEVHRELHNFDLTVVYADGQKLIIENKVKSLPYLGQLEEYTAEATDKPNTGFLLLSLTEPYFLDNTGRTIILKDGSYWHFLNYRELGEKLHEALKAIVATNSYHGQLIADYITFIKDLDRVQTLFHFTPDDDNTNFFGNEEIVRLSGLRMADFIHKLRYAKLANYVAQRLEQEGFSVIRSNWWEGTTGQFCITSDMTRGVGLFDLKYIVSQKEADKSLAMVGIQLQGNSFRLVFEYEDKAKAIKIAERLLQPGEGAARSWFDFTLIPEPGLEYPKKGKFNQYSGTFLYRSKNLNATSPPKLVELILEYAKLIHTRQPLIAGEVAEVNQPASTP